MENQPLVSIIIPTFNRADLIGETLDSIIAQTYSNWECIVVDDGSTDNTAEILKEYTQKDNRISYHHRPKKYKPGGNGARNYGFDISKGEYINWFDSDDVMFINFISEKVINIKKNDLLICSHYLTDEFLNIQTIKNISIVKSILYDYLKWSENFQIVTNNIMFYKNFLLKNKFRYNEEILRGQETEFLLKIFTSSVFNYVIVNIPLFLYRQHVNTKTYDVALPNFRNFNYSLFYVDFLKYKIVKEKKILELRDISSIRIEKLIYKFQSEGDFKNTLHFVFQFFKLKTIRSTLLSFAIIFLFFLKKKPKILVSQIKKII